MRAHVLNSEGLILNTIEISSLDSTGLILKDADHFGGCIGDSIINELLVPAVPPEPQISSLDLLISGSDILAKGPFKFTAAEIIAGNARFPKTLIPEYQLITVTAPESLDINLYTYTGTGIALKE